MKERFAIPLMTLSIFILVIGGEFIALASPASFNAMSRSNMGPLQPEIQKHDNRRTQGDPSLPTLVYIREANGEDEPQTTRGGRQDNWIYHCGDVYYIVGLSGGGTWEAAIRLTPTELSGYNNWKITTVRWYHGRPGTHSGRVKVYGAGTATSPGALTTSAQYTVDHEGWFDIHLTNPVVLDASKDIWVGVEVTHADGEWPVGADTGPGVRQKGSWFGYYGAWY